MHYLMQKTKENNILTSTIVDGTPLRSCIEATVPKYLRKYMAIAKTVGTIDNPCYSRQIGSIVVASDLSKILGTGYNGPPRHTPHTDTEEYIRGFLFPQLAEAETLQLMELFGLEDLEETCSERWHRVQDEYVKRYEGCKICPRKVLGIPSGVGLEKCPCVHSETNCIVNASCDLRHSVMFCWCGVPCQDCTKLIINSGVSKIYCLKKEPLYSPQSPWLLRKAGVELWEIEEEVLNL